MRPKLSDLGAETLQNLQRSIELLDLLEETAKSSASDLAWLQGARAKLLIACNLLTESPNDRGTLVSVGELILKAELCLASMDLRVNDLSMRIAEALLLETRAKIESGSAR
jgi:hypothetical protein